MNTLPGYTVIIRTHLLLLLLFSGSAQALNYDVELIIFEHARRSAVGASDTLLLPVVKDPIALPDAALPSGSNDPGQPIQPLQELRLLEEAAKIGSSENYRLLYHGGWRQPDYADDAAPFMKIALGKRVLTFTERRQDRDALYHTAYVVPPAGGDASYRQRYSHKLAGGIRVWVGRFLHIDTRLAYTPLQSSRSYRIETTRRMRSRQLHYIDHTRIGIVVKVFPVDESAPN